MITNTENHHLLILSNDYKIYTQIIGQADLPGLSILATDDPNKALEEGTECDLLFGEPSRVSKVLNELSKVNWVQSTWAGVEPLFAPGIRRNYVLTNARNVYGALISEYVFGYLLMIERQILARWKSQLEGRWDERPHGTLRGRLIGLLGVGTIGAHLAKTAHHFGMQVFGYTCRSESCPDIDQYFHPGEIQDFMSKLDYLICSLPGTPDTKGIINANVLQSIPRSAWLLNIGRGSSIDEPALVDALNKGELAGAVLDVFTREPLPGDNPLWRTPNTFITSHTAAINYPPDIAALFIKNYKLLIENKPLLYRVNFEQQY